LKVRDVGACAEKMLLPSWIYIVIVYNEDMLNVCRQNMRLL
jgi:hypothetical protein